MSKHNIFDIDQTPPFMAFRVLRDVARQNVGESAVLDLSQGEPGYGFAPSARARRFFAFLMQLDAELNNHFNERPLFAYRHESELETIEKEVRDLAFNTYQKPIAEEVCKDWDIFFAELVKITQSQNLNYGRFEVLYELFKYANLSGGRYPQPHGNDLLAAVSADEYSKSLDLEVKHDELIQVLGASHGIGTVFKALGKEAISYLSAGDHVLMTSPVYAPYNLLFEQRGVKVHSLPIDPQTGYFDPALIEGFKNQKERLKCIVLIDPNNPTGFAGSDSFLEAIADIAEAHNALIVTDEVYRRFFRGKKSILSHPKARKRTIMIDSLSKIERATGLRVGDIYISKSANRFISENILGSYLADYTDIFELMRLAKSPSGKNIGLFQHITGIPGPSVGLALAELILGRDEREKTTDLMIEKMHAFYDTLGLDYNHNLYYGMFSFRDIESEAVSRLSIYEKLERIARSGVVLMPANLFFAPSDREHYDRSHMVRVSLPNLSLENTKKAAQVIRDELQ